MHISHTMNVQLYEILEYVNELAKTNEETAIDFLQKNRSRVVVETYLKMNYDPSIVFQLPAGPAPYKKKSDVPDGYCMTDLKQEMRRMRVFTDQSLNLTRVRREQLWLQMCEGLFWKEADLINKIKDRRLTDMYPNITEPLVRKAFPNLLPEVVAQPVPEEEIQPVDFGEDPSLIPEEELIKQSIEKFLEEEKPAPKKRGRKPKPKS